MSEIEDFSNEQYVEMFAREWENFAPTAYLLYSIRGRGAFYVDVTNISTGKGDTNNRFEHVAAKDLGELKNELDEATIKLLETYDAENMVVLLVRRRTGIMATMHLGIEQGWASPKKLHEEREKRVFY